MWPFCPFWSQWRQAILLRLMVPKTFMSNTKRSRLRSMFSNSPDCATPVIGQIFLREWNFKSIQNLPALLTKMSSLPKCARILSNELWCCSNSFMLNGTIRMSCSSSWLLMTAGIKWFLVFWTDQSNQMQTHRDTPSWRYSVDRFWFQREPACNQPLPAQTRSLGRCQQTIQWSRPLCRPKWLLVVEAWRGPKIGRWKEEIPISFGQIKKF